MGDAQSLLQSGFAFAISVVMVVDFAIAAGLIAYLATYPARRRRQREEEALTQKANTKAWHDYCRFVASLVTEPTAPTDVDPA